MMNMNRLWVVAILQEPLQKRNRREKPGKTQILIHTMVKPKTKNLKPRGMHPNVIPYNNKMKSRCNLLLKLSRMEILV